MNRTLLLVAACGLVAMVASFGIARTVGPIDLDMSWKDHGRADWRDDDDDDADRTGPTVTREFTWGGGRSLTIEAPADVTYVPGPVAKLTVSGPERLVDRVEIDGDAIELNGRRHRGRLTVTLTAPDVSEFNLRGSQRLTISDYAQDRLRISVAGSGDVVAKGAARRVDLQIAGSGDADLEQLAADEVSVKIAGSGDATIAPARLADLSIAGSGDITLATNPAEVSTHIAGSGRIRRAPAPQPAGDDEL